MTHTPEIPAFIAQRRLWLVLLLLWGGMVGFSLQRHFGELQHHALQLSSEGARNMFRMVVLTRSWNAGHGGVYVPVNDKIQPNPYLEHPRRDLVTSDGQRLTMINPAFMTRLLSELANEQSGAAFHITSLMPIRPANEPDDWERRALTRFEAGDNEAIETVDGAVAGQGRLLRYMAPLKVEKACLKCHEKQGYKEGDIRGGISVTLPFKPVEVATIPAQRQSIAMHGVVFLLVAFLGGVLLEALRHRWLKLNAAIEDLTVARTDLETSIQALNEARNAAEAANVAKSAFLANMSHEIRTPMNAIIGMSHLTLKTELTTGQRNYLEKIQGASHHLLGVINDILDFSKIEAGKLTIEQHEFDLDALFDNVASQLGEKVASKGLELIIDIDPDAPHMLLGDSLRLGQILLNLGSNAVKFTEQGEINIVVRAEAVEDKEVLMYFAVSDTGIGLDEAQKARLFTSFQQADNTITRKYGGTGLGLAISKRMVELMGGKIDVDSVPGQGSNFWFTARFGIGTGEARRRQPAPDLRGRRMLVVDDNESAREVVGALLRSMSFIVQVVSSGMAALNEVRRADAAGEPFEVVLLDWQMPEMDGVTTARSIRALGLKLSPHLVMVTAYGRDDLLKQAQDAGIEDIVAKPVTASSLFDAIMNLYGRSPERRGPSLTMASGGAPSADSGIINFAGVRVLLVEDNDLNQEVATELLTEVGLKVDVAENGAVALEKLAGNAYDIVLMDMQMPVMDGLTATREIRQQPRFAELPIIAMTANAMSSDRDQCLAAGMNDHIGKPIDPDKLIDSLRRWIRRDAVVPEAPAAPTTAADKGADGQLAELRDVSGLNLAAGLRMARGREKLYLSLLRKFIARQRNFDASISAALATGDTTAAVRLAHTLKGVAGQVGAETIHGLASLLEQSILRNEQPPEVYAALSGQIGEMLGELVAAVASRLPAVVEAVPAAEVDGAALREVCVHLAGKLAAADFTAAKLLDENRPLLHAGLAIYYPQIASAIEDFDYPAALAELNRAAEKLGIGRLQG